MNQKHLLRFIKKTLKNNADEVVTVTKGKRGCRIKNCSCSVSVECINKIVHAYVLFFAK